MKKRKEEDFLKAFDAHADALFRHAAYRLGDRERALEITQETFLRAWNYVAAGGEIREHRSFLYRTLHNLIVDEYRKNSPRSLDEMLESETGGPAVEALMTEGSAGEAEDALDSARLGKEVRSRIPELPEPYRGTVILRFIDGLSISEIAEAVGLSENAVSVRIHRGVAKLRAICNL